MKEHLWVAITAAGGLVVVIVAVVVILAAASSGGGGQKITPGTLVGSQPLTSGYRLTGKLKSHTADSLVVQITAVGSESGEARNVVLRPGVMQEFDRPAAGTVQVARNNHIISSPAGLHDGDTVTLVGEFTSVVTPPAPAHDGYSFITVEASSKS